MNPALTTVRPVPASVAVDGSVGGVARGGANGANGANSGGVSGWRRLRRYWDTMRHLRARQWWHQARHRVARPTLIREAPAVGGWEPLVLATVPGREFCHLGGGRFRFLNEARDLGLPIDWTASGGAYLWRYHLHYFDCLGQPGMTREGGLALMRNWIARHPAKPGAVGWEPYPISLRVVNWLKFLQARGAEGGAPPGADLPADIVSSLALQGANLARQVEHHLLGNHLFANGKALWWLGAMLRQRDWEHWGRRIVLGELDEQFLADGGHFELSPMYHALMLEDLLDLVNLTRARGDAEAERRLRVVAGRAMGWLEGVVDARGDIPLLNDSALGMARTLGELRAYAGRLGLEPVVAEDAGVAEAVRRAPGWSARVRSGHWIFEQRREGGGLRVLFDAAPLGPDYLPGHAHADMLSVLLDVGGRPVFTDTGVPCYAEGAERAYCRGTAAHNTVTVDGLDQAEMWKSFRVGRRGHPGPVELLGDGVRCAHDGFAVQRPGLGHAREVRLTAGGIRIVDDLCGPGEHGFESRFHLAPGLAARPVEGGWEIVSEADPRGAAGAGPGAVWLRLRLTICGAAVRVERTPYHPEFGRTVERDCVVLSGRFTQAARVEVDVGVEVGPGVGVEVGPKVAVGTEAEAVNLMERPSACTSCS